MKKRQTHYRERAQPRERQGLGPLEKHRHFVIRSRVEREREEKIQKIKKEAAESNPEEFQFFMHRYRRSGLRLVKKEDPEKEKKRKEKTPENPAGPPVPQADSCPGTSVAVPTRVVFTD